LPPSQARTIDTPQSFSLQNDLPPPTLGAYSATAIVVGAVIGSGIFVSSPGMARNSLDGVTLLGIWALAGFFTLIGALTQCELCSQFPKTGGLYLYIKEVFGECAGFFYGWANLVIVGSGASAALAFIFSSYLAELIPLPSFSKELEACALHIPWLGSLYPFANAGQKGVGALLILLLTWVNVRGIQFGAGLQSISTTLKVLALIAIIGFGLSWSGGDWAHVTAPRVTPLHTSMWQSIGLCVTALGGAFWAYDGWGNLTFIAGEIKRPAKTIPIALIGGTLILTSVYLLVNVAYLRVLSLEGLSVVPGDRAASGLMNAVVGPIGVQAVAFLILLCTFDAINSGILTNPRVSFTMARDRLMPSWMGRLHPQYKTPAVALWMQGLWALLLLFSGSFDLVASMYVWVSWFFYFLMAVAVFICRKRKYPRTFTLIGYPYLPLLFACFTVFYLGATLLEDIRAYQAGTAATINSLMGVFLVLSGWPLYWWLKRQQRLSPETRLQD
jgi:APA family basic amino acid/polyamine antiporter